MLINSTNVIISLGNSISILLKIIGVISITKQNAITHKAAIPPFKKPYKNFLKSNPTSLVPIKAPKTVSITNNSEGDGAGGGGF